MLQQSKLLRSRDEWKCKAIQRSYEIREQRKTHKRSQAKIAALKAQIAAIEAAEVVKKKQ